MRTIALNDMKKETTRSYIFYVAGLLMMLPFSLLAQFVVPPGKYVLFEEHRLYYYCQGEGDATVLVEGGIGDASVNWLPIQEALSKRMQVCLYDRGGYGMSDTGPGARTTEQIVAELYRLVKTAGVEGPYIIVGQSFGGFIAQYFARRFPEETLGIVLVDSSHPDQVENLGELDQYSSKSRTLVTGRYNVATDEEDPWRKQWHMLNSSRKAVFSQMDELKYFDVSASQVREAGDMPNIPVAVLTRDQRLLPTLENNHSMEEVWREMQRDLANSSERGWQVTVKGSGHNIHLDAPEAVIEAVNRVYDMSAVGTAN